MGALGLVSYHFTPSRKKRAKVKRSVKLFNRHMAYRYPATCQSLARPNRIMTRMLSRNVLVAAIMTGLVSLVTHSLSLTTTIQTLEGKPGSTVLEETDSYNLPSQWLSMFHSLSNNKNDKKKF